MGKRMGVQDMTYTMELAGTFLGTSDAATVP